MGLKVFRLHEGRLQFIEVREVKQGDIIVTGETSMAQLGEVRLREVGIDDFPLLNGAPPTPAELAQRAIWDTDSRKATARGNLRAALKRAMPDATEQGLDAAVRGRP